MLPSEPVDGDRAGRDGDGLDDEQQLGVRPDQPQRGECGQDRVEVRAQPGDLLTVDIGDREEVAVRGRPDRLRHVSEIEATAAERAVPKDGRGAEDARERGGRDPDDGEGSQARTSCSTRPTPVLAEHALARPRPIGREAARADLQRQLGLAGQAAHSRGQRLGVAGRDEQRALAVKQQLARRRRVGGNQRRAAGESLERLVRDHAARLRGRPEDAERTPCVLDLLRQPLVVDPLDPLDVLRPVEQQRIELSAADDPERNLRREPCSREDCLEPVQRDQLADEERVEGLRRLPPGPK